MTVNHLTGSAALPAAPRATLWADELRETWRLAWPIALTQLGQVAMMTTDLMLLGQLGEQVVAATALAHTILFATFVLGMGLVSAVAPLASQAFGARQPRMVRRALRVGLWASVLLGLPLTYFVLRGEDILRALGQQPEAAALAAQYLNGLALSLVPGWWFIALRSFMGAVNRPGPGLWIMLAAVPLNLALAYALIYGAWGMPELGLFGAGLATSIINLVMCVAAVWVCYTLRPFAKFRVLGKFWRADWPLFWKLLVVGGPMSGSFLLEYGLFAAAALVIGWISIVELAAHQIALMIAAILFMVPMGVSMAATVRVGHAAGRRDAQGARRAGMTSIAIGGAFMAAATLAVVLSRNILPLAFIGDSAQASATVSLAATLLVVGTTFFIADGVQGVAAGALRGLNDTRIPLLFTIVCFWVIGFPASYLLGIAWGGGTIGVWIGLSVGIALYAIVLVWRFHVLTARGYLPEIARA